MKLEIQVDVYHHFVEDDVPGVIGHLILARFNSLEELMSEQNSRLAREVAETRDAVNALTGRYQSKIDTMQQHIDTLQAALDNGDTEAAKSAADALDALQTEMASMASETPQIGESTEPPAGTPTGEPNADGSFPETPNSGGATAETTGESGASGETPSS